jgi:hypothetical protein
MTLLEIREHAITPALALLPARMTSLEAEVMLLAIGLQESRFEHRRQLVGSPPRPAGPAKSFWQAEQGGGMVSGLLRYHDDRVRDIAAGLCAVRGVPPAARAVWDAIEYDDVLAAGLARLLLFTDPARLPALGDVDGAWQLYLRTWRPGKPHPATWAALYEQALAEVMK